MLAETIAAASASAVPNFEMHFPGEDAFNNMKSYWSDNYMVFSSVM